jgi:hypothetical protein
MRPEKTTSTDPDDKTKRRLAAGSGGEGGEEPQGETATQDQGKDPPADSENEGGAKGEGGSTAGRKDRKASGYPDGVEPADGDEPPDNLFSDYLPDRDELYAERARLESEIATWKEVALKAESERRFIETELMKLQNEVRHLNQELKKLRAPPHILGTVLEVLDENRILVKSSTGPRFCVNSSKAIDIALLKPGTQVSLNRDTLSILEILPFTKDTMISSAEVIDKPYMTFDKIGGLEEQKLEIKETVELPLTRPSRSS